MNKLIARLISLWIILSLALMPMAQAAERVTYYHLDLLGSPVAGTDEGGAVVWREQYKPYGQRMLKQDGGTKKLWYTGKAHDEGLGLSYFGARWYNPQLGRFTGVDPVDFQEDNAQSFNRYAYANNNPYKYVDPNGETPLLVLLVAPELEAALVYTGTALTGFLVGAGIVRSVNGGDESDVDSGAHEIPKNLVGAEDDKSGPQGNRYKNGPLAPENGGVGDAQKDFERLSGKGKPAPDNYPPGTLIGDNGITLRPGTDKNGPRIDIPSNDSKPHETLHYPKQ